MGVVDAFVRVKFVRLCAEVALPLDCRLHNLLLITNKYKNTARAPMMTSYDAESCSIPLIYVHIHE